jgi:hypothetical protein
MKTNASTLSRLALSVAATLALHIPASAQLITSNPLLPPDGVYLSVGGVHAMYSAGNLTIVLKEPQHLPFAGTAIREILGPDERETFDSQLNGRADVIQSGTPLALDLPFLGNGPVQTMVFGKVGNVTGTFNTEMLSMSLSGTTPLGPFIIRESPTLPSLGQTKITDIGGGLYRIDSFFDVFTEISIDGGATWIPSSTGASQMVLVPEPGSLSLLGLGAAGLLGGWLWRRRGPRRPHGRAG